MSVLKFLLFPFSFLYGLIIGIRNLFFDFSILKSKTHTQKVISIGNLSMGGTGKSPVALYITKLVNDKINLAILSRGYGRKTKGFKWVEQNCLSSEVGDEPLLFKTIIGDKIPVAVCEDRNIGVEKIENAFPQTELVLLDDAFQHRKINPGFSILLTTYQKPFFRDVILPMGTLRECRNGAKRANVILITKCPNELSTHDKKMFKDSLEKYNKPVFFSRVVYGDWINFTFEVSIIKNVIVVSGIANPTGMIENLAASYKVDPFIFADHHEFTQEEIAKIHRKFDTFVTSETAIVTTQKDFMRLKDKTEKWGLVNYPWYVLPITIEIENEIEFNKLIFDYVGKN